MFDVLYDLKTPKQENCQEGPNGECVVPAYKQLNFNITQYTDDSFSTLYFEEGPLIANDMVYLTVQAPDMNEQTTFAIRQCSFVKGEVSLTLVNPDDAEPVCTNDLIDLDFKYETDENGVIRALISHRLFVLGRGNTDFYKLSCDVTVCDIDETDNNTCEQLKAQCDNEAAPEEPETSETDVSVIIETGDMWSEEYADPSSEVYTSLVLSVSDAVTKTFEDSAAEGYVLTEVDVSLMTMMMMFQDENAGIDCF